MTRRVNKELKEAKKHIAQATHCFDSLEIFALEL